MRPIVLVLLIIALIALSIAGYLFEDWWPVLVDFLRKRGTEISALQASLQILIWLVNGLIGLFTAFFVWRSAQVSKAVRTASSVQVGDDLAVGRDFTGGDKKVASAEQGVVIDGNVEGSTIMVVTERTAQHFLRGLAPDAATGDLRRATQQYLLYLLDRHQYLSLKGMGVADRIPLRLPLLELYVPLKARRELPAGETWDRSLRLAGRELAPEDTHAGRLSEPQPVLELLQERDGLVILGDPGAGKTTFLKYLALQLALGEGEGLGLGERLPILAPLSGYANALQEADVRLDEFIAGYFHDLGADLPVRELLTCALGEGKALVLLDGLDEVKDPGLRLTVVKRVEAFYTLHRRAGNKFVLTSRIVGYRDAPLEAAGLAECTLVDFEQGEIEVFVRHWTTALERQAQGDSHQARGNAERERDELLAAVAANPGVRQLAANPLLLTILALMKRQGVTLPERRVELYEQYVKTLLSSWNRARGLGRPPSRDLDVVQTVKVLAPLACWMHEVNPGVGLVKREALKRELESIYQARGEADPETCARTFLEDVRGHAALLLERGPDEYGFIHLTFEEYLAAVAIALNGQGDASAIAKALGAHVGDPAWREVALLSVGYVGLIQQLDSVAGAVVEHLVKEQPGEPGEAVVLAGEAVLDAWPAGVTPSSREQVVQALVVALQDTAVPAGLRRQAGLVLGRLGWRPDDLDGFVEVLAGRFQYGRIRWNGKFPIVSGSVNIRSLITSTPALLKMVVTGGRSSGPSNSER